MSRSERAYWLAWSRIPRIGPVLLQRLQNHFGTLERAWAALPLELAAIEGVGTIVLQAIDHYRSRLIPLDLLEQHEATNPCFWTPADPDYPRLLLEIPSFPVVLYYKGQFQSWENQGISPTVSIVGTRDPTDYGKRWTRRITHALTEYGFTVVSGLADGIDTEAHTACLERGGRTIAVVGTGVDVVYPSRNRSLYHRIVETGLVLSEYPQGTPPDRAHFPQRNRIIAALSRATLIMEAPSKSGALITANLANEFNRDVYSLPGSLDSPQSRGCLELIAQGAQMILGEEELLTALGAIPNLDPLSPLPASASTGSASSASSQPPIPTDLDPLLAQVFALVSSEPLPFDRLVEQSQLSAPIVSSALLQLELMALVSQMPGMRYQRSV